MLKFIKITFIYFILISFLPFLLHLIKWEWEIKYIKNIFLKIFFIIIKTLNIKEFIILFLLIFFIWFINLLISNKLFSLKIIYFIIITILLGQNIKLLIRNNIKINRPYVDFFTKNKKIFIYKSNFILKLINFLKKNSNLLNLDTYNINDRNINSSFISGHTLLLSNISMIFLLFLFIIKYYLFIFSFILWSTVIIYSRIILGMHYPIDIILSVFLSFILVNIIFYILK